MREDGGSDYSGSGRGYVNTVLKYIKITGYITYIKVNLIYRNLKY